jgi:hypothetical protein
MEARVMALCPGAWKNFDEIESSLILDELLLLFDTSNKVKYEDYRFHASLQGIDMGAGSDEPLEGADDLPQEVIEAERQWKQHKEEVLSSKSEDIEKEKLSPFSIGYFKS